MSNSASARRPRLSDQPTPEREADVLRLAIDQLRSCLPETWRCDIEIDALRQGTRLDAILTLEAADGVSATLVVEAKRLITTRDVPEHVKQLRSRMNQAGLTDATPMLVARYLPPSTRARLESDSVAYADATGNLRVVKDRPALFVRDVGQDRDPWRGPGRPRGSLKGTPAARVIRSLVDFSPPYTVPELVARSGASTGATYRVVEFLEEEALLERTRRGPITYVAWRLTIERWSQDYGFQRSATVQSFLFPRGVEAVPEALRSVNDADYALTGSLAAQIYDAYAPARLAMIYVADIATMTRHLDLRPVDRGANVLLAANKDEPAFLRTQLLNGLITAAPSQVAVDLLTGPGRSPSEGQALLDWMEGDEQRWRS